MIEQAFHLEQNDRHAIEKVIADENVNINHMILSKSEGLPEHFSNSNVYMAVIRGLLSIDLNEQGDHEYPAGTIVKIPKGIKMNVQNTHGGTLELLVIKAPAPGK